MTSLSPGHRCSEFNPSIRGLCVRHTLESSDQLHHFRLARGARRWRKAWGEAQRNPRLATIMKLKRAKRAIEQKPQATDDESAVAHFAGWNLVSQESWGSARKASLTPGFTLSPRSAG